jgi:hypothetical protein
MGLLRVLSWISWDMKRDGRVGWLFFAAFYAIFANVPFWAASRILHIERNGWFCLEYAGVGLLALFMPKIASAFTLLFVMVADAVCGISQSYFLAPSECLTSISYLRDLPGTRLFAAAALVALMLLTAVCAAMLPSEKIRGAHRYYAMASLIGFVMVLVLVDSTAILRETGHIPNPFRLAIPSDAVKLSYYERVWLCRLPLIRLVRNETKFAELNSVVRAAQKDAARVPSAVAAAENSAGLTGDPGSQQMPNLVVILVESWGLAADPSIRNRLDRAYFQPELLAQYKVLQGTVPFYGSTVAGEARELCGSDIGFHLLTASKQELQDCLPHRLEAMGYHTIALHGMDGHMFNRSEWYSTVGFQETWFEDRFRQQGLTDCVGAFTGTCDAAAAGWIARRLDQKDPHPDLVYWVTLNSHLPVPTPPELTNAASCLGDPLLMEQNALCSWFQLVSNVHHSVSQLAMSHLARPSVFVIVGDHAPPFADAALRDKFSDDVVPYVLLFPRDESLVSRPHS